MIGIDSNVLVRYLAQDDPRQSARATRLLEHELTEREPGYLSLVVLVETCWVLRRLYAASPDEIRATVRDPRQLTVENRNVVARALARLDATACDIADALIVELSIAADCRRVVSFDRDATKLGMVLLQ